MSMFVMCKLQAASKNLSSQMQQLQQQVTDSLAAATKAHQERQAVTDQLHKVQPNCSHHYTDLCITKIQ